MSAAYAHQNAEKLLHRGIELLRVGDRLRALSFIEKAHQIRPTAETSSYKGLLIALDRGRIAEGIAMCQSALDEQPENPRFLFNLGRALYKAGRKSEAFDLVRKSLLHGGGEEPKNWLMKMGIRKPPVFRFLPRNHPLNKYTGLALRHLGVR